MTETRAAPAADPARGGRIAALDAARSLALVCMAIYHFCFDLEMFGWLAPGTAMGQPLRGFAVAIASSFIAMAGFSLVLAHGRGIRWRGFRRRLAMVAGAALAISAATWLWLPSAFIYFGILHAIAAMSLIGLAFLRLPAVMIAVLAAGAFWLPRAVSSPAFDTRRLAWTGFAERPPPSLDFEPVFPWIAAFLAGMALARAFPAFWQSLAARPTPGWLQHLGFPGRHSLLVYLVHQPVLIAVVGAATWALR
ncbi:DUF1624 domain-containing protein [Rhodobacterales bacterium HKCCE2091]|nr:DUF1624 domain-containing protein [Rhodobacterales bacterium HKCCE2091]